MTETNTWQSVPGCAPPGTLAESVVAIGSITLIYVAAAGQRAFPLNAPDRRGNSYAMTGDEDFAVFAGGNRVAMDDGTLFGGFTVDAANNSIDLIYPAGPGEVIVIDIFTDAIQPPPAVPPLAPHVLSVTTEPLPILTDNTIPDLSLQPDGSMLMLIYAGRVFLSVGTSPDFSVSGRTLTWLNPHYTLAAGATATAIYSV